MRTCNMILNYVSGGTVLSILQNSKDKQFHLRSSIYQICLLTVVFDVGRLSYRHKRPFCDASQKKVYYDTTKRVPDVLYNTEFTGHLSKVYLGTYKINYMFRLRSERLQSKQKDFCS